MRAPISPRQAGAVVAAASLGLFGLAAAPAGASPSAAAPPASSGPPAAERPMGVAHAANLPAGTRQACAAPTRLGQMQCQSRVRSGGQSPFVTHAAAPVSGSYGPVDLQSAYNLSSASSTGGSGEAVAVVDAYEDPNAASDLVNYRRQYGLPPCANANGIGTTAGCLTVLNQNGQATPLPGQDPSGTGGWEFEESLDLDMVSAICPNCSIVLIEAKTDLFTDLGTAENSAVRLGAKFVSNSWSGLDYPGDSLFEGAFFDHPGVAATFASGDFGYSTGFPASSPLVTSVGGTFLTQNPDVTRGWDETVWNNADGATGSGCSAGGAKASWQKDSGCLNRTENDVSAVADGPAGISVYDTYPIPATPAGWLAAAGTSAATPIVASVYALAGSPAPGTYPSSYLYQTRAPTGLNDVTTGSNGTCETIRLYVCQAQVGYDGPTGFGTPDGTSAFRNSVTTNVVSVINPGTQDYKVGSRVNLPIGAIDSAAGETLAYTQTGLPTGLSISPSTGVISGTLPTSAGTSKVTVTASDSSHASDSVTFNLVRVPSLITGFHPVAGPVRLHLAGKCLDDFKNRTANGTKVDIWTCNGTNAQNWTYRPNGNPGGAGVLTVHGKCMDIVNRGTANGSKIQLWTCNGGANQQWYIVGFAGELFNPASGKCLDDTSHSTTNGKQVEIWTCNGGANQAWTLPASPVQAGVAGKCLDDTANRTANGTKIEIYTCNGKSAQKWTIGLDGSLRIHGKCLDLTKHSLLDGARLELFTCNTNVSTNANQLWVVGAAGQLENLNSQKCLDDPGDSSTNGTQLVQQDCYSNRGEIWALS